MNRQLCPHLSLADVDEAQIIYTKKIKFLVCLRCKNKFETLKDTLQVKLLKKIWEEDLNASVSPSPPT